jgi:O-antigen/teichoic acid export membrane protein
MLKIFKKMKSSSFLNHSKNYLIAEFFNKGLMFLTIPIFTRLLTPDEYGILAVYGSIVTIFTIILGLNFHGSVARYYYEKSNDFNGFLKTNILFLVVFNGVLIPIFYISRNFFGEFFQIGGNLFVIAVIVSILSSFFNIFLASLQASQNSHNYAKTSVFVNSSTIIIAVIWTYFLVENRYYGNVYSQFLVLFSFIIFLLFRFKNIFLNNSNKEYLKYALFFGVPLIPHALSGIVLAQFDRIMINQLIGSFETGIYSFAYNVGLIMNVIVIAMNNSWVPIFYEHLKNNNYYKIQNLAENYSKLIFTIAFALILFGNEIVTLMADNDYFEALSIVPIIIVSYVFVFLYMLYGNYSFYHKKTGLISFNTFLAGFVNIGLNYLFIPKYGYMAAAWTTLVSYVLLFVLHYCNSKYILKENVIGLKNISKSFATFGIFLTVYYTFVANVSFLISEILKIGLCAVLAFIYFKKDMLTKNLKSK